MTARDGAGTGVLGILGGMGPYASTDFLRTVYELADERLRPTAEQHLPRCVVDSDPAFPDRTEAIAAGEEAAFAERLRQRLLGLFALGATRVVIACVTAHHFLDRLEPELRRRLISLVDVLLDDLEVVGEGRFLLLATDGTRRARVFEDSPRWPALADRVVLPDAAAQTEIHQFLYRLKREPVTPELAGRAEHLAARHDCQGLIAGCTEVHLLTRWWQAHARGPRVIDPLRSVAADLEKLLDT